MRALLVVVALAGTAAAQPSPEDVQRAAELYDRGKRHFDIAEYAAAIAAWKEAYLLSSEPLLLFNIAQAHRLAGDCAQANRFYLNYKRVQPKPPNEAELESAMAKCDGVEPATGDATTPAPATTEPPAPSEPAPTPVAAPAITPAQPAQVDVDRGRTLRLAGIAIAGAGVVASALGVYFAFDAKSAADDVSGQSAGTVWGDELAQTERDGKSAQLRARVLGISGAIAVLGGAGVWWYGRSQSRVRVDVAVTPQHSQVSLSCAF